MRRGQVRPTRRCFRWTAVAALALLCCGSFVGDAWGQFGGGYTWATQGPRSAPARIVSLSVDAATDSTLYFAAPGGGVWKSTDGGQSWGSQSDSLPSQQFCSVLADPVTTGLVYGGTGDDSSPRPNQGVVQSSDGGRTWTVGPRFTNSPVCLLSIDPQTASRILAGSAEGAFLSNDSGRSWKKVISQQVTSVSFNGQGNIYAGVVAPDPNGLRQNLLARSSDGGLTWTNIAPGASSVSTGQTTWVSVLAAGNTVYAALAYHFSDSSSLGIDLYRSTDGGSTWTLIPMVAPGFARVQLLLDSTKNLYLLGNTVLRSRNGGDSWIALPTTKKQFNAGVFTGGSLLLAGEKGLEAIALADGAFAGVIANPLIGQYLGVTADFTGNSWAGGLPGLYGVLPGFPDWQAAVTSAPVGAVVAAQTNSQNVLGAGNGSIFHTSNLSGPILTFTATTAIPAAQPRAAFPPMVMDSFDPNTIYVAGQQVYRTSDGGATWTALGRVDPDSTRVVTALAIASVRQVLYAATVCVAELNHSQPCPLTSNIFRSTNSGQSWTKIAPSGILGTVSALATDVQQPGTLYAAMGAFPGGPSMWAGYLPGDLQRSTDGGATWLSIRANLPQTPINAVVVDPNSVVSLVTPAQTLYVGTDLGVFFTKTGGLQWSALTQGLPAAPVTSLFLRRSDNSLRAATFGRGIFQIGVSGLPADLSVNPLSTTVSVVQGGTANFGLFFVNTQSSAVNWQAVPLDAWITIPQSSGQVQGRGSTQFSAQVSAANLSIGTYIGRIRITTSTLTQDVWVTLNVTPAPARIAITAGNNATGVVGSNLPALTVQVFDAGGAPLPGVTVTFVVSSGGGVLSQRNVDTDTKGQASTVLTLPGAPGKIQVVCSAGTASATFNLTAVASTTPALLDGAAVNAATFLPGVPLGVGSIVAIFGSNLADSPLSAAFPLPAALGSTQVFLSTPAGDIALPLFYVSPQQVNALLPADLAPGAYLLSVQNGANRGSGIQVQVATYAPAIFTLTGAARGQGLFINSSGTVSVTNPARRGSIVTFYATGLGPVNPPVAPGAPASAVEPLNRTTTLPRIRFDVYDAEVLYCGLAPGFAGLYQINARVPTAVSPASNIPVGLIMGAAAGNVVTIPIQ